MKIIKSDKLVGWEGGKYKYKYKYNKHEQNKSSELKSNEQYKAPYKKPADNKFDTD